MAPPTPTAVGRRPLRVWHYGAVAGDQAFARVITPGFVRSHPMIDLQPLGHGDPEDLLFRARQAVAGGVGPDVLQLPGEWIPDAAAQRLIQPLPPEAARMLDAEGWTRGLVETSHWQGAPYGIPAALWFRQPFFDDALLRNAGLFDAGRTTTPSTWAEYGDVSRRVAAPDDRWGSMMPSYQSDEDLFLHVYQYVHTAGGELPRRDGDRVMLDTPALRASLQFQHALIQQKAALPFDRPPFRLAAQGKVGIWWATPNWLRDASVVGFTRNIGATHVPRNQRGGALLRSHHWCLSGSTTGASRDDVVPLLGYLADDEVSYAYSRALFLPPARSANVARLPYPLDVPEKEAAVVARNSDDIWSAVVAQIDSPDNAAVVTFPGYRTVAARAAGEFVLVLTGRKPIDAALSEGEAGIVELLRQEGNGS